jgi:hypothetical protein
MDKFNLVTYAEWVKKQDYKKIMIALLDTAEPLTIRAVQELSKMSSSALKDMMGR